MGPAGRCRRQFRDPRLTTKLTYEAAPPFPDRFVTSGGPVLTTAADIVNGKAGFQKADLMDYGSLYGMGSYFGEDYTAAYLGPVRKLLNRLLIELDIGLQPSLNTIYCGGDRYRTHQR